METAITCTAWVPERLPRNICPGLYLAIEKSDLHWEGGTIRSRTVGAGCPEASRNQVCSELCHPRPILSVRTLQSFLREGRLPPTREPCWAHQGHHACGLRAADPPAAGGSCCGPRSHSESLLSLSTSPQRRRRCKPRSFAPNTQGRS